MSIAKTKEAIEKLADNARLRVDSGRREPIDTQKLPPALSDLKALAASHTRLLEAAKNIAWDLDNYSAMRDAGDPVTIKNLKAAVAEAET